MHIRKLPRDDQSCGWYRLLPEPDPPQVLCGQEKADWVVIGGGFVGLSAARHLASLRPNDRIVLIEALRIGQGASGRNSGFVIDLPHKRDLEHPDVEFKRKIISLNEAAIASLENVVEAHRINCQWSRAGRYQAAVGSRGVRFLSRYKTMLDGIGHPYTWLDRQTLNRILGTSYYEAAIYIPTGILMQPAALVRGLAKALPGNVKVYESTPVVSINRHAGRIELQTVNGSITCPKLILGTNVFSAEFGFLKSRILPVMTFASITRPLTPSEFEIYGGSGDWGITPADHAGTTLRLTADRRFLIRNQYQFAPDYTSKEGRLRAVRRRHRQHLANRYPALRDLDLEYTWGGVDGLSRNYRGFFGEVADGIYSSACHHGVGAARGTISGQLLAELATNQNSELLSDMFKVSGLPALNPPEPFLGIGVRTRMLYEAWASRSEH